MRAILIKDGKGPVENLYIGEAPKPTPKSGEVLVKVEGFIAYNRFQLSYVLIYRSRRLV
jgi:hypothetical protein